MLIIGTFTPAKDMIDADIICANKTLSNLNIAAFILSPPHLLNLIIPVLILQIVSDNS
jgi:hypothetical protein